MNPEYDELLVLAETLGEVKSKTEKLEAEFSTQARPLEAATNALSAALAGIKALQFHVLDNNLGQLSARVEEMRKAVDEQVGVIALELKRADETNAAKAGQDAEALRAEIAGLQAQLGTLGAQFSAQLERVEFSAKEEAKKLQLIPGPAGAAGASLNPRGTFVDGETYNRLDVVSWLGSSYIAAVDGVTEKPSKNSNQWQVLASRGSGGAGGAGDFGSLAGVAQINQGGTGQTTRAAGLNALLPDQAGNTQYMLLTDGAGTVSWGAQPVAGLPSQTSNGGKLLTTDGTNASWSNAVTVSGSNATVTGTLTVNGAGSFTSSNSQYLSVTSSGTSQNSAIKTSDGTTTWYTGILGGTETTDGSWRIYDTTTRLKIDKTTGNVSIAATTASTTTSTGALVVGNGTSGGLGVGGAANIGGKLAVGAAVLSDRMFYVSGSTGTTGASQFSAVVNPTIPNTVTTGAYGLYLGTNIAAGATVTNSYSLYVASPDYTGSTITNKYGLYSADTNPSYFAGKLSIADTTASTSTSSGALVVSGGVGVAKRIHSGEGLTTGGDNETHISFVRNGTVSIGPTASAAPKLSISSAVVLAAATQSLAAWGDIGAQFAVSGSVLTDTQSSGTVSRCVLNSFASTNIAAAGTTTFTQAATLFVAGGPTAGTNVTITNAYAIYTAGGRINFQGLPTSSAGLQAGTLWNDSGTLKVA